MAPRALAKAAAHNASEDAAIDAHSESALATAKRNFQYLRDPKSSSYQPSRFRTRAALRFLRSLTIFIFWRVVRYAKYVAIGSLVAAVGATAFGSVLSGAAFVLAPTGIAGTIVAGTIWGVGKWGARRFLGKRAHGGSELEDNIRSRRAADLKAETGPEAMPW